MRFHSSCVEQTLEKIEVKALRVTEYSKQVMENRLVLHLMSTNCLKSYEKLVFLDNCQAWHCPVG